MIKSTGRAFINYMHIYQFILGSCLFSEASLLLLGFRGVLVLEYPSIFFKTNLPSYNHIIGPVIMHNSFRRKLVLPLNDRKEPDPH